MTEMRHNPFELSLLDSNPMERSPSWEASSSSVGQEIPWL